MSKISQTPTDYAYLNVLLNNDTDEHIIAEFNETRRQPILTNMQDFQLGVTRLKIPTAGIPLFVFQDEAYKIGFSIGPNNTDILGPIDITYLLKANNATNSPANRYIFYYTQFLEDVNAQLQALWNLAIVTPNYQAVIDASLQFARYAPYFRLGSNGNGFIELILPNTEENVAQPFRLDNINILMNNKLFYFFSGFSAQYYKTGINLGPLTYRLQPITRDNFGIIIPDEEPPAVVWGNKVIQDYPSLFLWQSLSRIFITTTIQIDKEVLLTKNKDNSNEKLEVLTDFEIPQTQQGLREYIYYVPQGELRWINFKSTGWLDRFDMRMYFQTKDLKIYPITIPPTFEASMKIEFKRRTADNLLQHSSTSNGLQFL